MAHPDGQLLVIPATCSTHPDAAVIELVARGLNDGRIELTGHGGYPLTVHASVLFDALGQWLG